MKLKILAIAATITLSGCASSPDIDYNSVHPEILSYCQNVGQLYGQVHDLKGMKASRGQALTFMGKMIDDSQLSEKDKSDIREHARHAVYSVYENPKTSRKGWVNGITEQCVKKPDII